MSCRNLKTWNRQPGRPLPLGASITPDGVNFSVFSRNAESVTLVLFEKASPKAIAEIPLDPDINRTGDIWHIHLIGANRSLRYAYRAAGPFDPKGKGHRFNKKNILLDPYARALEGGETWGGQASKRFQAGKGASFQRRCLIVEDDFDWEGDRPLNLPLKDCVIYELHVRGYTVHESSGVTKRGTYKGLIEKIPYIKSLGVTTVELMPVFEFNELENKRVNPKTGERLKNFWGYSTMAFFAPKASYASNGWDGNQVKEFKEMVKAFHRAGLEVVIDVVFNHTAESKSKGPVISFRGLDNSIYYILERESRRYLNLSGCGNTVNCNHPVVQAFILDCLRYWVVEMHVDGFRFDLAPILRRDHKGGLLPGPSLIDAIEQDQVLARTKIIAEAWDAKTNQVGHFPGRWAEWNSHYRDDVRRFGRGDRGMVPVLATRIGGSSDLYQASGRRPFNSINYITCHDGFTLYDLVSYNHKHNEENGEDNKDGSDQNFSSNSGVEGPVDNSLVHAMRLQRIKTFATILMVSHGVPMILAGDEFGRTQLGNNNPYCQDNVTSWIDWRIAEKNAGLLRFFRKMIALRNGHPVFRRPRFLTGEDRNGDKYPDVSWQGLELGRPDWSEDAGVLAFLLDGSELAGGERDDDFFVILNGDRVKHSFEIPRPPGGRNWFRIIDTSRPSPEDILDKDKGKPVILERKYSVLPMAAVVFISRRH
ncbi:MAG: glycogen debranching protein GlgX [Desulfobacterales bacterium]|nr:glycogen debranching protein GlgX [Desulfobacterales bacterium]